MLCVLLFLFQFDQISLTSSKEWGYIWRFQVHSSHPFGSNARKTALNFDNGLELSIIALSVTK